MRKRNIFSNKRDRKSKEGTIQIGLEHIVVLKIFVKHSSVKYLIYWVLLFPFPLQFFFRSFGISGLELFC